MCCEHRAQLCFLAKQLICSDCCICSTIIVHSTVDSQSHWLGRARLFINKVQLCESAWHKSKL